MELMSEIWPIEIVVHKIHLRGNNPQMLAASIVIRSESGTKKVTNLMELMSEVWPVEIVLHRIRLRGNAVDEEPVDERLALLVARGVADLLLVQQLLEEPERVGVGREASHVCPAKDQNKILIYFSIPRSRSTTSRGATELIKWHFKSRG